MDPLVLMSCSMTIDLADCTHLYSWPAVSLVLSACAHRASLEVRPRRTARKRARGLKGEARSTDNLKKAARIAVAGVPRKAFKYSA